MVRPLAGKWSSRALSAGVFGYSGEAHDSSNLFRRWRTFDCAPGVDRAASMRAAFYFAVGFLLAVTCGLAYAEESIPATQQRTVISDLQQSVSISCFGPQFDGFGGPSAACSACVSYLDGTYTGNAPHTVSGCSIGVHGPYIASNGQNYGNANNFYVGSCPTGSTWDGDDCVTISYSCPVSGGWSLVNQSCVRDSCLPGETRDEFGVCQAPEPECNNPDGTILASGYYNVGTSASGSPPVSACLDHCTASFEGSGPYEVVIGGVKNYFMQGAYYSDGSYCGTNTLIVPGSSGLPSSSCGANQNMGTVNGKTVCVDKTTNQPVPTDAPKTTTEEKTTTTNPDGSTTETTTKTNPDGTKTTTTVVTGTNGTKTTTTTTNGGQSEQPADGSATEATQKDILNELKKKDCEKDSTRIECQGYDIPAPAEVDLPAIEKTVSITPVSIGPAGSCPSDHVVDFLGQPLTISWALPCQYATGIRPVVLTVAWLSAALILVGGFKQE